MKLLRLTCSYVFPDGVLETGTRIEVAEIVDGAAVVFWQGKRRRLNPADLEEAGAAEHPRRGQW